MKSIMLKHYKLYPKMQIQDMVKLLYQNEFGAGHMVKSENCSLGYLLEELDSLMPSSEGESFSVADAFEDIGNGLCRLHFKTLPYTDIKPATVNRFFLYTANTVTGNIKSFERKLGVMSQCCADGEIFFSARELESYLSAYKKQGYPPVSHSEAYRKAYSPSYRVIKAEFRHFFELFSRVDFLLDSKGPVFAAIDGNSGSGKSSLAALLAKVYDCNILHMDDYFLTPELRTEAHLSEIGGNIDYVRFRDEVITGLQSGREFEYRPYDCRKQALKDPVKVKPKKLNIIEGCYSMHPVLAEAYNLKVFLHVDRAMQLVRIRDRNGEQMYKRFLHEWIPMEDKYFREYGIRDKSDLVFPCYSTALS